MNEPFIKSIKYPSICLTNNCNNKESIETECLFGEKVKVWKTVKNMSFVTLLTDNYSGWVNSDALGENHKTTHRVISIRTFVYVRKDIKSVQLFYLSLGSKICVETIENKWAKIKLHNKEFGYVMAKDITKKDNKILDWVQTGEKMLEIPYKWGGRDTLGLDCSALIQLSLQSGGFNLPRNSSKQKNFFMFKLISCNNLKRGDLVFWPGHVGVMTSNNNLLHANAYHMKVCIELFSDVLKRNPNYNAICRIDL